MTQAIYRYSSVFSLFLFCITISSAIEWLYRRIAESIQTHGRIFNSPKAATVKQRLQTNMSEIWHRLNPFRYIWTHNNKRKLALVACHRCNKQHFERICISVYTCTTYVCVEFDYAFICFLCNIFKQRYHTCNKIVFLFPIVSFVFWKIENFHWIASLM